MTDPGHPVILIIEDNPQNARLMKRTLENKNYTILHAEDGESGLEMAYQSHPQLILLDLGLPDVDGQAVAARLKQDPDMQHIPLVVVTAWPSETAGQMIAAYGCEGYIAKPIDTRQFPAQVASFLPTP
jgi:CheY-like chemotaxis protein